MLLICTRRAVFQAAEWTFVRHVARFLRLSRPCVVSSLSYRGDVNNACGSHVGLSGPNDLNWTRDFELLSVKVTRRSLGLFVSGS